MSKFEVILEIEPNSEAAKELVPEDWFWTNACPAPNDDITFISAHKLED